MIAGLLTAAAVWGAFLLMVLVICSDSKRRDDAAPRRPR